MRFAADVDRGQVGGLDGYGYVRQEEPVGGRGGDLSVSAGVGVVRFTILTADGGDVSLGSISLR